MLYSVQFYALSGEEFARMLGTQPDEIRKEVDVYLDRELRDNIRAISPIRRAANSIFNGMIPKFAAQEYFDALFAILNVNAERISLAPLQDFKHYWYLDEAGFWPWFQQEAPPFPLPRAKEPPPEFGYASARFLRDVVLPGIPGLRPCDDAKVARNQFSEIAESVADDGLDLVGYFTVW